jgi:hypothetical protein
MQQDLYGNLNIPSYQRRYRICGVLNVRHGGPVVCFIWLVCKMIKRMYKKKTNNNKDHQYVRLCAILSKEKS